MRLEHPSIAGQVHRDIFTSRRVARALVLLLFFALQFPFWFQLTDYNRARAAFAREQRAAPVLGADIRKYREYFEQYPASAILSAGAAHPDAPGANVFKQYLKRPLYGFIFAAANYVMVPFAPGATTRMDLFSAFFAALAGTLLALLLLSVGGQLLPALLAALLGVFSFSWLSMFSIPESYSVTIAGALIALLSGHRFLTRTSHLRMLAVQHGAIVGVAAWLYPPLCGAAALAMSGRRPSRQYLLLGAISGAVALLIAMLPQVVSDFGGLSKQAQYGRGYLNPSNLLAFDVWLDAISLFLFFNLVAPVQDFVNSLGRPEWPFILTSAPTLLGVVALSGLYLSLARQLAYREALPRLRGVMLWLGAYLAFAIVYDAREMLLLAPIVTTIAIYTLALVAGAVPALRKTSLAVRSSLIAAAAALLFYVNAPSIFGPH